MSQELVPADAELDSSVDCLLMPLKDRQLILPNVTVAEIIPLSHLLTINQTVDWVLGRIEWRGIAIPVICYELLNEMATPPANSNARFAVVNGVGNHPRLPFFAMLIQNIPRVRQVQERHLRQIEAVGCGPFDMMSVTVDAEVSAFIPNLDQIEARLLELI